MLQVLLVVALFQVSRFLVLRAQPPFPPPALALRGSVRFDSSRVKEPTLLAVAVSPAGRIGMLDSRSGVAQVFSPSGAFLYQTPAQVPGAGRLRRPLGLSFGEEEELYLADTGNQRVVRFGQDGLIRILGTPGIFNGQFVLPTSLAWLDGRLVVLDSALCRIQQFDGAGTLVGKAGRKGAAPGAFLLPTFLARDPDDNLWVLDRRGGTLSQFDLLLNFLEQRRIAFRGEAPGGTFTPSRVAFAGDGLMFFLSRERQEIVVFYRNTAIEVLTPAKLGLESAWWTDLVGQGNSLYLLDGKNHQVDILELT